MPSESVICQDLDCLFIILGSKILKRADANVTCRHAGQHRPWQRGLAEDRLAGSDRRQRARRGDTESMHRLADDIFAEDRAQGRPPIATAREGGPASAFE